MKYPVTTRRQREVIVTTTLAVLLGGGVFFFFLLVLGLTLPMMMATLGVLALVGIGHYLVWGRRAEQDLGAGPAGTSVANERTDRGWPARPSRN